MELHKFENVDIVASLDQIMKQNTGFYQTDLECDKKVIADALASSQKEDKTFLWLSRPSGTYCFRERDVFLNGTGANLTWRFYQEQVRRDRILAYAIELTGKEHGEIRGNLYELDYVKHYKRVKETGLRADNNRLIYEHGEKVIPAEQRYLIGRDDAELGKFKGYEALPHDPDALQTLLLEEHHSREQLLPGNFKEHISDLRGGLIKWEAKRIVQDMEQLGKPNSPDKTHFMIELSPTFQQLAEPKDIQRLSTMLPYKTLSLSKIKGKFLPAEEEKRGMYALVDEKEIRQIKKLKNKAHSKGAAR